MVKIKLTLGDLFKAKASLEKLYSCDIPVKKAFRSKATLSRVNELLKTIIESRNDIVKKYGVDVGNGNFSVPAPKKSECDKVNWTIEDAIEANEKMKVDFDVLFGESIDLDIVEMELGDLENSKLSVIDMDLLEKFIKC